MAGNYANVLMDMFETSPLNNFYKKNCKETGHMATLYRLDFFWFKQTVKTRSKKFLSFARNAVKKKDFTHKT